MGTLLYLFYCQGLQAERLKLRSTMKEKVDMAGLQGESINGAGNI